MGDIEDIGKPTRRTIIHLAGSLVTFGIFGGGRLGAASAATTQSLPPVAMSACVVRPEQAEGPYFVDERLNRSDIRLDPTDGTVRDGVPLRLILRVSRFSAASCTPLSNVLVDVWQCDALGAYSDVRDIGLRFNTVGKKFLRGYQVTDANGSAQFTTVYPGWYPGRTVHIHFKLRTNPGGASGSEFTSQLYFDDSLTDRVHAAWPYNTKGRRTTLNRQDGGYRSGGDQLLLQLSRDGQGYSGTFEIGLQI